MVEQADLGKKNNDFGTPDPNGAAVGSGIIATSPTRHGLSSTSDTVSSASIILLGEEVAMLMAGVPMLPPPSDVSNSPNSNSLAAQEAAQNSPNSTQADITKLQNRIMRMENDVINASWDAFMKSLRDTEERTKKEALQREIEATNIAGVPKYSVEEAAFLAGLSLGKREEKVAADDNTGLIGIVQSTYNTWIAVPINNPEKVEGSGNLEAGDGTKRYPDPSFIAAALVSSLSVVALTIGSVNNPIGFQMSVSPVADALSSIGPVSGLPGDYQSAIALIASLLNNGAVYKATTETVLQSAAKGRPPRDLDFALNYTKNIIAIVTHRVGGADPTNKMRAAQNQLIRLMLSTMALNLLYRAAYGGATGEEFEAVLNGEANDLPEMIRPQAQMLAALINSYLPTDPKERAAMVACLMDYVDSKDSVDSMLETTRLFKGFLGAPVDEHRV